MTSADLDPHATTLFAGPGDARARARAIDWAATPLGPVTGWPAALRTAVRLCLDSRSAMAVWAGDALTLVHNDAYTPVLGAKAAWAMGRPLREVWAEVWEAVEPQFRRVVADGEPLRFDQVAYRLQRHGREEEAFFAYGLTPIRDDDGRIVGAFNVLEEITLPVQARSASEDRYRALFDAIDEGFCIVEVILDADGQGLDYRFLEINPAFERHTGLRDAMGRTARELVPGLEPHWPSIYGRIATTGVPERFVEHSAAMGRWFEVDAFRIGRPDERHVALLFRDITARREAEAALREGRERAEEADRQKNRFLAVLSHELRNPLGAMRNSLHVLARDPPPGEPARRALDVIERQTGQLAYLVNDLLDVARITLGKVRLQPRPLDLDDVVRRTMADHAGLFARAGIESHLALPPRPVRVAADAHRLSQVVGNLLQNAVKFTPRGGCVGVSVSVDDDVRQARLTVQDSGLGIAPELLPRLFEPFVQADETLDRSSGGLGLGLALVRRLVELQGGSVEARSDGTGAGATFDVRLPLLAADAAPAPGPAPEPVAAPAGAPGRRVLVIDDNVDGADSLRLLLELLGHGVAVAHDGPGGLAAARAFRPDVVLCDIGLPGLDGYAVAAALRAEAALAGVHLVALSGYAGPDDVRRALAAGFARHLAKPPTLEQITQAVASAP